MLNLFTNGKNPYLSCIFATDYAALFIACKCCFYMWLFASNYLVMEASFKN